MFRRSPALAVVAATATVLTSVVAAAAPASAAPVVATPAAAPAEDSPAIRLQADTFRPQAGEGPDIPPGLTRAAYARGERGYWLVQLDTGPVDDTDVAAIEAAGAEVLGYVPDMAFKVAMTPEQAEQVEALPEVGWVGLFHPAYRLSPARGGQPDMFRVVVEQDADPAGTAADLERAGARIDHRQGRVLRVVANAQALERSAHVEGVAWIEPFVMPETHNEYGGGAIMGATTAHSNGYDGSGQVVAVADTGLGDGTTTGAHPDIPASRVTAVHDWPAPDGWQCWIATNDGAQDVDSGHGTHTAASVVSDGDAAGVGLGTAPGASLVFQAVEDWADMRASCNSDPDGYYLIGLPNDLTPLYQQAFDDGARVHSNSWGSDVAGAYTVDAATTDDYVWDHPTMAVTFSAGNAGIDANGDGVVDQDSIGSPGTAKNVITVGASENDRGGDWACDTITPECAGQLGQNSIFTYGSAWGSDYPAEPLHSDPSAGDAEQMAAFSSRGPTDDGRIKPDVVAPGTWVLSGYSDLYQEFYDGGSPNPQNGAWQYDGYGYPASEAYKYMSGTSMSNPLVAGGAAVLRDFYATEHGLDASAALVKATMVNSAVDLLDENNDGVDDNDYPIPNSHEGWGRVDLAAATDGSHSHVEGTAGLSTAGTSTHTGQVAPGQPFKATLVWSDAPATSGAATTLVNDLDLVVTSPSDIVYRGNVFAGGWSQPGGTADAVNNVENVFLPSEGLEAGEWTVDVVGTNVPVGPQPFALVVDHATPSECLDDLREEDDTPATATDDLTSNFTVTDGALCDAADYFLVNTAGDEVINASLTPAAGGDALQVDIIEVDGSTETVLANEAAPAGTTSTAVHQVPAGAYYVRVTGADASAQNTYALDVDVTLAPPDRTIAFSTDTDGDNEVAVVDESGTSPLVLTDNTAYDGHPFWSPDRSRIAFTSDRDGDRDIWVMDADGGNPQQLTGVGNPSDDGVDEKPAWSPDGTEIAFVSDRDGPRRVFVMNADGTSQWPLTLPFRDDAGARDDDPAWSPDGRQVVMSSMPGGGTDADLWLVDRDGSGVVQLTSGPELDTEPDWSHDGSSIVFRRDDGDGIGELWAVTPNGAYEDLMLTGTPDKAAPSWSPAGDRVVHVNRGPGGAGDAELEIVVADGGATSDLVPGTAHDADPDWGTDGTVGGPVNDNLADALRIEGPEVVDGHRSFDTTDATTEPGETAPQGSLGNSVWWEYTGPSWASRAFFHAEFDTPGDVVLAVYRDTNGGEAFLGDLELVSSRMYVPSSAWETMDVPLEPDETVYLQLYGDDATAGPGSLDWWSLAVNDRFADAITLEPASGGTTTGNNEFASTETDEPDVGGTLAQSTVWWTWTAPADGEVVFDTDGSEVDTLLDVFSGTDLATLFHEGRADPDAPISVPVIANEQLHVRIDTVASAGDLALNWCMDDIHEPNDTFGTAEPLTSGEPINAVACDDDFYSIDAAAGETVAATLTWDSQGGTVPMTIQLLDADGVTVLDGVIDSTTGEETVSELLAAPSTVFLRLRGEGSYSAVAETLAWVQAPQGDWVGAYGGDGYVVGAWGGAAAGDDLVWLPDASVTVERGSRYRWAPLTTSVEALEAPDESVRRATTWYDLSEVRVRLDFPEGYQGQLHLYAVDWKSAARRQTVEVFDGQSRVLALTEAFTDGAWVHVPVDVAAGGSVTVSVSRDAGANAVLSGIFLGDAPEPITASQAPQGDWVGAYGGDGYVVGAWGGAAAGDDLVWLPDASVTVERGSRYRWAPLTTSVEALEAPDESVRRATTWYDLSEVRVRLDFPEGYQGQLHLYAVDWKSAARRQTVEVFDGQSRVLALTEAFTDGAWVHVPVDVAAGGSVTVSVSRDAGANAVLSGIFLGDAPEPITASQAPQGDWVGAYGGDGYVVGAWGGAAAGDDLVWLPDASVTVERGSRYRWAPLTTSVEALEAPDESVRRATTWYDLSEVRVRLDFPEGYQGQLHLYAVDWKSAARRQTVEVFDGQSRVLALTEAFTDGAWVHVPVDVAAGGSVTVSVSRDAGANAVLSGIFLGGAEPD